MRKIADGHRQRVDELERIGDAAVNGLERREQPRALLCLEAYCARRAIGRVRTSTL